MATAREVRDFAELVDLIRSQLQIFGFHVDSNQVQVSPYVYDERIGWDTYIITVSGYGVWGMANGPVSQAKPPDGGAQPK